MSGYAIELIDEGEFDELVGHLRQPSIGLHEELEWLASDDRAVVGLLLWDRVDSDYSWVVFARRNSGYETVDVAVSLASEDVALHAIRNRMVQELRSLTP